VIKAIRERLPDIVAFCLWLFLLWNGQEVVRQVARDPDSFDVFILDFYCIAGSTAVALAVNWLWKLARAVRDK
jgi:hypothetical protein